MENLPKSSWIKSDHKRSAYQIALLAWYDQNMRELPWRENPSLYKTVISEFMLQQTRVATVLPYFQKWITQFPDFVSLSQASEEKVMKAWEGLGYYSRARNLQRLAKIAAAWKEPPPTLEEWQKLPGIGPYIAAAVTSISLNKPEAVCDGNVVRVLSRVFAIEDRFKDGATAQKKIRPLAQFLIHQDRPGDYNQAVMELGATVCHRSSPLCSTCPILSYCKSGKHKDWNKYPVILPKPKKTATIRRYWVENADQIILYNSQKNRLQGVLELPEDLPNNPGISEQETKLLATRKRTIGQVEYTEEIYKLLNHRLFQKPLPKGYQWIKWSEINRFTLSGPHRKWISELRYIKDPP
ncbi:MAG: A/G-specific adenine glycosylase [Opitutae bacterium]